MRFPALTAPGRRAILFLMAVALDTLAYAKRLREAGFTEQQAEAQAEALATVMTDSVATKQDLREMEMRIDARFAQVDARFAQVDGRFTRIDSRFEYAERHLDARLTDLEHRMTMRLGGLMVTGIGAVSVLVKLL
jgi:hypothetical protein